MIILIKAALLFVIVTVAIEVLSRVTGDEKKRQIWFTGIICVAAAGVALM